MVFGGIGLASFPADLMRSFFGRPVSIITKSEYIRQARGLAQRAREIKVFSLSCQQCWILTWSKNPVLLGMLLYVFLLK